MNLLSLPLDQGSCIAKSICNRYWSIVGAQLAEWSLMSFEHPGSNPSIGNFIEHFLPGQKFMKRSREYHILKYHFYKNYVGLVCTSGHNTRVFMYYLLHWSFHTINFYVKWHCKNLYKTRNVLKWQTSSYDRTWISLELKMIFRIDRDKGYLDRPSLGVSQTMPILRQKF